MLKLATRIIPASSLTSSPYPIHQQFLLTQTPKHTWDPAISLHLIHLLTAQATILSSRTTLAAHLWSPCFSSCPSSICPPCCSHRDICKRKIKPCYSPKRFSLLLAEIPVPSHHLQSPVRSEPCLPLPNHRVPLSHFPTQHPGLLSVSMTHQALPTLGPLLMPEMTFLHSPQPGPWRSLERPSLTLPIQIILLTPTWISSPHSFPP